MAYNPGSKTKLQRMQSHIIEQRTLPKGASPSKLQKNETTDEHR